MTQRVVAQVILNRASHPHTVFGSWRGAAFADNLRTVILRPWQFSSFNPGDPNHAKLMRPLDADCAPGQSGRAAQLKTWERCLLCAQAAGVQKRDRIVGQGAGWRALDNNSAVSDRDRRYPRDRCKD